MLFQNKSLKDHYGSTPFGIMIMKNLHNPLSHQLLDAEKKYLEDALKKRYGHFTRGELKEVSPIKEYASFYKTFKKTYHVQLQLESISKGLKSIPSVAPLVEAMFMAELETQLLTAGYDLDQIEGPLEVSLSSGNSPFLAMGKKEKTPPEGDILLKTESDILGSIICGPDHKARITKNTKNALFAVFGVPGIKGDQIKEHFETITRYIKILAPDAYIDQKIIL